MPADDDPIVLAEQHVAQAERIVVRQKALLSRLQGLGADTRDAAATLDVFQANLQIFKEHRDYVTARHARQRDDAAAMAAPLQQPHSEPS